MTSVSEEVIQNLQLVSYGGVAAVALLHWRRRPGRASAWLAASFGVMAVVIIAGRLIPEESSGAQVEFARKALVSVLVLFPYFLYRFMITFVRPIPWFKNAATALTALVAFVPLLLPPFPEAGSARPIWLQVYVTLLLIQWVVLTGVVAIRLWRASRGQPTLPRRRMRTMSIGASGLAVALVVAGEFPSSGGIATFVVQVLALAAAPLMLIGFAPPYSLRAAWRKREDVSFREAEIALIKTTTASEVAQTLLPHARGLIGADAVVLQDAEGNVITAEGLDEDEAASALETSAGATDRSLVTIPMFSGRRLTAIASRFTAFFGNEEMVSLEGLAGLADLALARNELLESQRRLAAIVESSDDAIIAKSLDGTILAWNPGAEKIYGYTAEEALGQDILMLVPDDMESDVEEILKTIIVGKSIEHYETKRQTKDGRILDVSLTVSPIRDASGRITAASAVARDVSARVEMERQRESARDEADRANRAKNEFLSRMSHELRTPMNAILGFAQLLEMDGLSDEQKDWIREILKAGQHLLELINEVLDISRIEAGKLRLSLEPVDVVQTIDECISLLAPFASEESIELRLDRTAISGSSVYVMADRQRFKQVMLNIISNGIKYNRENGHVRIWFELLEGDKLRTSVTDTGQGIAPSRIKELFAPFERLGAEELGIEGTGLGLALSKPLVEAMGGTISVASEVGKGTTFSVELDVVTEMPASKRDPESSLAANGSNGSAKTILYIEDNLTNLKLLERLLDRRPEIRLLSAMQGGIGVTLARNHQPDLILLDLNLPDMPGEEVLGRLRSDPRTAKVPVVVLTAETSSGQVKRLLEAGARAYLTKPLEVDRFFLTIDMFSQ
jgi:PAS domain S-box-containing protein